MIIQFSQKLIRYLPVYLGTSLGEISKIPEFPFSRPYLYKLADGSAPVNHAVNEAFNVFWEQRGLTPEDLDNLYGLIDFIETGSTKEKQFQGGSK